MSTGTPGLAPEVEAGLVGSGRALSGIELKIAANQRICVRGPTLCSRFVDGERPVDDQGWLQTEDRGYLSPTGELFVFGRSSDLIVTGGENVDPLRVEAALLAAPGVVSAVVFGLPDPRFGELVACALVTEPDCDLTRVRDDLSQSLAPYELPRRVAKLAALPLLDNGKVHRTAAREQAALALAPWNERER